ncbi:ATP-binding protein [Sphaerochaeta sp. UBA5849]|jgi:SpoVK/Ycf46/Vps4 family AAA+-type ATPase|uniref:AAA family ATPase n=1 Tax=Sphaerochaeta sp. UBA5849 TaxID=1947475 RepID=UPI0031F558D9
MARADLLYELIQHGLAGEKASFRLAAEAICAEERAKQHVILAKKLEELLEQDSQSLETREVAPKQFGLKTLNGVSLYQEINPSKSLNQLVLTETTVKTCTEVIEEQMRSELLRSYGIEPRNKILLYGPPGNGKTSLAEAIANALMVPLYMVTYDTLIGAYLGETASNLAKLFQYARTRQCVLFFDEFETLGKERGDRHETGEIKRVVSSLLMNIDALPSYVVVIAATNHEALLDIAAWRRFQVKIELGKPSVDDIQCWLSSFEKRMRFSFNIQLGNLAKRLLGKSYAEVEEFALSIYRQYILKGFVTDTRTLTEFRLNQDSSLSMHKNS